MQFSPLLRRFFLGLIVLLCTAASCMPYTPQPIRFDDPRILRGSYSGTLDDSWRIDAFSLEGDNLTLLRSNAIAGRHRLGGDTNAWRYVVERQGERPFVQELPALRNSETLMAAALTDTHLALVTNQRMQLFRLEPLEAVLSVAVRPNGRLLFSPDKRKLLLLHGMGDADLIDLASERLERQVRTSDKGFIWGISHDNLSLLGSPFTPPNAPVRHIVNVWNLASGSLENSFEQDDFIVALSARSAADIYTLNAQGTLRHWGMGGSLRSSESLSTAVRQAVFAPDGETLALLNPDEYAIWHLGERQPRVMLEGDVLRLETAQFSSDSRYLGFTDFRDVVIYGRDSGSLQGSYTTPGAPTSITVSATPTYESNRRYRVNLTLESAGNPITLEGFVDGQESESYLAPQARPPFPPTLEAQSSDGIWRLSAESFRPSNGWYGHLVNNEDHSAYILSFGRGEEP